MHTSFASRQKAVYNLGSTKKPEEPGMSFWRSEPGYRYV
jgi:hypothetical protein